MWSFQLPTVYFDFQEEGISLSYTEEKLGKTDNYMDKWILSFTQSLIKYVRTEMQGKICESCVDQVYSVNALFSCVFFDSSSH